MSNRIKKISVIVLVASLTFGLTTGCGRQRQSDQVSYRQYGINCIEAGQYEEAVSALQKALDESVGGIGEMELDICKYKAQAQYLMGDIEGAEETYTSIINYNNSADAHYLRGCMYFATGEENLAKEDFANAVLEDEKNLELYIGIAETFNKYEKTAEANEYLNKAMNIKCKNAQDYMHMGRIYMLAANNEKAVENFNKSIEDGNVKANFYLGQLYANQGDETLAQTYYDEYINNGNADAYELCEIGKNQMASGSYQTAIKYFDAARALEDIPNKQLIMRNTIIAYEKMGDFESAKNVMAEYLDLYPDDDAAEKEYTFLQTR